MAKLAFVILTLNEEIHIQRCIRSVTPICDLIVIVDSGSSDKTVEIAKNNGAVVYNKKWVNYSDQFNYGLDQIPNDMDWVFRLDADEVVTSELADSVRERVLRKQPSGVGYTMNRRIVFLGQRLRFGGMYPIRQLRLFKRGEGRCESRWMDEHIILDGSISHLTGDLVDDNRKPLTWWVDKHNGYASREAVDLLSARSKAPEKVDGQGIDASAKFKRKIKYKVYARLPIGLRAFLYFVYRLILLGGLLDGRRGIAYHFLQGFWYRYLVDMKCLEVTEAMKKNNCDLSDAVLEKLGIDIELFDN